MIGLSDEAIGRLRAVANWPEFESERYTVSGEIGRGGMGTVYAAIDTALGREVALKVSNTVASAAFERRLAAEAKILARLEHPGIVPVHDVGRLADGRLFYVMKLVHGRTLRDYLQHASDLSDRLRIFERICEAVAFAHARRILHRDLKPDNVMIGSFGEVMVMDWGVATALSSPGDGGGEDPPGTVLGTHGFMAPEQARGELDQLDERTDVYGLGAILFALLTRQETPIAAGTPALAALAAFPAIPVRSGPSVPAPWPPIRPIAIFLLLPSARTSPGTGPGRRSIPIVRAHSSGPRALRRCIERRSSWSLPT